MRKAIIATSTLLVVLTAAAIGVGEILSVPAKSAIGSPPPELRAEVISFLDSREQTIVGWYSRGAPGKGSVLLLHGLRSDRRQMTGRATYLHELGFSVLLIDLQAHGESDGERITFGYREADGVRAAISFLRAKSANDPIGVIGVSLGAASFVLSETTPPLNAVVLESMYPTIEEAVTDRLRLRLGSIGSFLTPILVSQLKLRLGIDATQLRPIDHIASIGSPVLIISGTEDQHTTVAETKHLYDSAVEPKELWLIEGAAHVDLYTYAPKLYEKRISQFLGKHLGANG